VAALLAFMSISGIIGWLNIQGAELFVDLPEEMYAGLETLVTVRLVNRRRFLPSFLLKVDVQVGSASFDLVECGSEAKRSFTCTFRERGEHRLSSAKLSSPFPINFFIRSRGIVVDCRLVVFPALIGTPMAGGDDRRGVHGPLTFTAKGYEGDVAKIVDYSGSEPFKLIHWKLSAKYGELKVKELSANAQSPVMIDVDAMPGRTLEEKLSRTAYLVNELIRGNRPVGLKLRDRQIPPAASRPHRLRVLTELALYAQN
jgi:uncharacterized protein (DUF58 family)